MINSKLVQCVRMMHAVILERRELRVFGSRGGARAPPSFPLIEPLEAPYGLQDFHVRINAGSRASEETRWRGGRRWSFTEEASQR